MEIKKCMYCERDPAKEPLKVVYICPKCERKAEKQNSKLIREIERMERNHQPIPEKEWLKRIGWGD